MNRTLTLILTGALSLYVAATLIAMAPMNIAAGALIFLFVFFLGFDRSQFFSTQRPSWLPLLHSYLWASLALAFACVMSLVGAHFYPLSYGGHGVEVHFLSDASKLWYLFWPWILAYAFGSLPEINRKTVIRSWYAAFALLSGVGLVQFFTGWPRPQGIPNLEGYYHVTLGLGHHLSVASIFIFPFFFFLNQWKHKEKYNGLRVAILLLGLIALVLTFSRGLWISLLIGLLLWALLKLKGAKRWALLGAFFLTLGLLSQWGPIQNRISHTMGVDTRLDLWKANWDFFLHRPVTGVGFRHTEELSGYYLKQKYQTEDVFQGHAHNNLIEMLGSTGLLGVTAWLFWSFWVLRLALRKKSYGLFCAWVVFFLNGMTQVNFWEGKVEHQMAWVVALLLVSEKNES